MKKYSKEYSVLRRLGLSKTAITCYENLFNDGSCKASELAARLKVPQAGLYRLLKPWETIGFVSSLKTGGPTYYFAVPLAKALYNLNKYHYRIAGELIDKQQEILLKRRGFQID